MPDMRSRNILVIRLTSFGDLVHTLPAAAALRSSFPEAGLDWVVEEKWAPLLDLCPIIRRVIPLRRSAGGYMRCARELRAVRYDLVVDFQGLYKSALLARVSGAARRVGFDRRSARESGAAWFYTEHGEASGGHAVEKNLELAVAAGAQRPEQLEFPLSVPKDTAAQVRRRLAASGIGRYVLVSPGGTWRAKCWPPERYGALCAEIRKRHGLHAVISAGPGELPVAEAVARAAEGAEPAILSPSLAELAALAAGAEAVVTGDTGPMHLAAAIGAHVVALFGPTDPARFGPLPRGTVVRDQSAGGNPYRRSQAYSPEMLAISVAQVVIAVEREIGVAA